MPNLSHSLFQEEYETAYQAAYLEGYQEGFREGSIAAFTTSTANVLEYLEIIPAQMADIYEMMDYLNVPPEYQQEVGNAVAEHFHLHTC